ncbi:hypothetical protein CRG98_019439 [Punica granatum]|uniref:Uncharacterized protein n=1 Tax=Punica granatum TaxID=22663 RepID=A0A2I0JV14_PUNGR|nr:hypothetical protein CRG98_019439 [Punica granatum]
MSYTREIVDFLKQNLDVFAWETFNMPRIDPSLITHYLIIKEGVRPVVHVWTRISYRWDPHACTQIARLGSAHLPEGRATDTRENESPIPVYDPEVEGR